jgi:hypothetical protein
MRMMKRMKMMEMMKMMRGTPTPFNQFNKLTFIQL